MIKFVLFVICVILVGWAVVKLIEWVRTQMGHVGHFFTRGYKRWVWLAVIVIVGIIFLCLPPWEYHKDVPQNYSQPTAQKVQTSKFIYFKESKSVSVYLKAGFKTYPKGGMVKIKNERGVVFTDEPGVNRNMGYQPDGLYTFVASENATGVEIYNYWE